MSELEQQTEEIEALTSIYEGDSGFKQLNNTTFQYKVNAQFHFDDQDFLKSIHFSVRRGQQRKIIHHRDHLGRKLSKRTA